VVGAEDTGAGGAEEAELAGRVAGLETALLTGVKTALLPELLAGTLDTAVHGP